MILLKNINDMPTDIRQRLFLTNKDEETELVVFYNNMDKITLANNEDLDDFVLSISKEDWEEIKLFIDKEFAE